MAGSRKKVDIDIDIEQAFTDAIFFDSSTPEEKTAIVKSFQDLIKEYQTIGVEVPAEYKVQLQAFVNKDEHPYSKDRTEEGNEALENIIEDLAQLHEVYHHASPQATADEGHHEEAEVARGQASLRQDQELQREAEADKQEEAERLEDAAEQHAENIDALRESLGVNEDLDVGDIDNVLSSSPGAPSPGVNKEGSTDTTGDSGVNADEEIDKLFKDIDDIKISGKEDTAPQSSSADEDKQEALNILKNVEPVAKLDSKEAEPSLDAVANKAIKASATKALTALKAHEKAIDDKSSELDRLAKEENVDVKAMKDTVDALKQEVGAFYKEASAIEKRPDYSANTELQSNHENAMEKMAQTVAKIEKVNAELKQAPELDANAPANKAATPGDGSTPPIPEKPKSAGGSSSLAAAGKAPVAKTDADKKEVDRRRREKERFAKLHKEQNAVKSNWKLLFEDAGEEPENELDMFAGEKDGLLLEDGVYKLHGTGRGQIEGQLVKMQSDQFDPNDPDKDLFTHFAPLGKVTQGNFKKVWGAVLDLAASSGVSEVTINFPPANAPITAMRQMKRLDMLLDTQLSKKVPVKIDLGAPLNEGMDLKGFMSKNPNGSIAKMFEKALDGAKIGSLKYKRIENKFKKLLQKNLAISKKHDAAMKTPKKVQALDSKYITGADKFNGKEKVAEFENAFEAEGAKPDEVIKSQVEGFVSRTSDLEQSVKVEYDDLQELQANIKQQENMDFVKEVTTPSDSDRVDGVVEHHDQYVDAMKAEGQDLKTRKELIEKKIDDNPDLSQGDKDEMKKQLDEAGKKLEVMNGPGKDTFADINGIRNELEEKARAEAEAQQRSGMQNK